MTKLLGFLLAEEKKSLKKTYKQVVVTKLSGTMITNAHGTVLGCCPSH